VSRRSGVAGVPRAVAAGAVSAAGVGASWRALRRGEPRPRWDKTNYQGRPVSMLLGPAVGAGAAAGMLAAVPAGRRPALLMVATVAAVGAYDDLYGDRHARGLGGHARALAEGRVTTGVVKLVALTGAAAAASAGRFRNPVDVALGTVLVAGSANLVNLFDLRPGRATKVAAVAAALLTRAPARETRAVAAVAAGAALAAMPADLGEQAMLGDCGAGTLGALLGWAAGLSGSRRRRLLLAVGLVGLTVASERVSFSEVIDGQPALRALDRLGRRRS
jgi:UDP-GlcNAc:undecaprenyl-phosphate/decaprenyl-phosphate GlcNAc-1-phosphate transferase